MTGIAVVGMACRYPDAASPTELWENALAGRRAFRRLPDVRMRLEDYWDADPSAPDRFYARNAAVIEGYEFDRLAYRVAGSTYRSTDLTHWLALDMAAQALADAGFPMAEGLPRERAAVIVGNTLTGEFSRANLMRLRWPYVRRVVGAALAERDEWDDDAVANFLDDLEGRYKRPFPAVDEDSLAGGLANTIAGRICNHFDLKGGGYTVDGACSSSLLSVSTACKSLLDGECDVAIAGGVDLSIDPFEIVGFAKTGALARSEMRVYDRGANGFWPGEGCGMVVLMRHEEARRAGRRVYAVIAGWGISSDGRGGITRPELSGYQLALRRAYQRAGFGIDTVSLFEGHGTGTAVGDTTELMALSLARRHADPNAQPAAISSVKAMIGHTKAAAGVAGLIKATMAAHHQVLPPAVGCVDPHPLLTEEPAALRVLRTAEPWPTGAPVRAAVTAMGFGGINTHVVLENREKPVRARGKKAARRGGFDRRTQQIAVSAQDVELLLVDGGSPQELRDRLARLLDIVPRLSYAQLADLAVTLQSELRGARRRAAVVVSSPEDAERKLRRVRDALDAGETDLLGVGRDASDGCFLADAKRAGRIGYLFPGQGSGRGVSGGALRRRLPDVARLYQTAALSLAGDTVATTVAQPRIVTGSMAGLRALSALGVQATVAVGHSLGEISALQWAGVMDEEALLRVASVRGSTMAEHSVSGGMGGVGGSPEQVAPLCDGLPVVIAGHNGPTQTVVAGPVDAVRTVGQKAAAAGLEFTSLAVSHAFHSPLVAPAADSFAEWLTSETFGPLCRRVVSTVTGDVLAHDTDVPALLRRQITDPVLFAQAVARAAQDVDLFVEVGPGRVLSGLAAQVADVPAIALDTDDESLGGLLRVLAAAYVIGAARVDPSLFESRLTRPLRLDAEPAFFASPCEAAPATIPGSRTTGAAGAAGAADNAGPAVSVETAVSAGTRETAGTGTADATGESNLELLRRLAAERAELPVDMVDEDSRLLDDLHLSSITVGQVMNQAAQKLGVPASQAPTNFATATVRELSEALGRLMETSQETDLARAAPVAGAAAWSRAFSVDFDAEPPPARWASEANGRWRAHASADHPYAELLRRALEPAGVGGGVLVCLPRDCAPTHLELALQGAKEAAAGPTGTRFVLVQHDRGAAGLAKTLRLEAPHVRVTIVTLPAADQTVAEAVDGAAAGTADEAVERVVAEVAATAAYAEAWYDAAGVRRAPTLRAMPIRPARTEPPLDASDVLLVTGGGKGITAECALAVAQDTGAALALLGRSDPETDQELAANLRRMAQAGATVRYVRADVTDAAQTRHAVNEVAQALGPVTAVLHGAGRNEPATLASLDMAQFHQAFAPKIDGLRAVLDAVDPARLRLLVTFGSIIGRAGLRGEAHYATANEWLADLTREVSEKHPHCRALCLEWSVWSGVGMGERLSVVESLAREGVAPITPDDGVRVLRRLLADPEAPAVVVISGRAEGIDTVRVDRPALPLLRFIERPLIHYHGVELVAEAELSADTDLYVADHLLDGNYLFPAVFGMEAMAQAAAAVTGAAVRLIEDAEFLRPIVVPPAGGVTVRIAAAVTDEDTVDVVIRSAETGFAAEHFRARFRVAAGDAEGPDLLDGPPEQVVDGIPEVPLEPLRELYGDTLFQGGRFQRLRRYHRASARHVDADVAAVGQEPWFASFLPAELLLGDAGARDALMHGNQVCVPDATLLPTGVERIHIGREKLGAVAQVRYCAMERSRDGDAYVYDVVARTSDGRVVERWDGLRLQAVRKQDGRGPWAAPLLGSYLERKLGDLLGAQVAAAVEPDPAPSQVTGSAGVRRVRPSLSNGARQVQTETAASRALGRRAQVRRRPDGRPEIDGGAAVSASHGAGLTLCVTSAGTVGCDVEPVAERSTGEWDGLLGQHAQLARLIAAESGESGGSGGSGESFHTAATRVWTAVECLQKIGLPPHAPITLLPGGSGAWRVFASGNLRIATLATSLRHVSDPVVFAVLTDGWS